MVQGLIGIVVLNSLCSLWQRLPEVDLNMILAIVQAPSLRSDGWGLPKRGNPKKEWRVQGSTGDLWYGFYRCIFKRRIAKVIRVLISSTGDKTVTCNSFAGVKMTMATTTAIPHTDTSSS